MHTSSVVKVYEKNTECETNIMVMFISQRQEVLLTYMVQYYDI